MDVREDCPNCVMVLGEKISVYFGTLPYEFKCLHKLKNDVEIHIDKKGLFSCATLLVTYFYIMYDWTKSLGVVLEHWIATDFLEVAAYGVLYFGMLLGYGNHLFKVHGLVLLIKRIFKLHEIWSSNSDHPLLPLENIIEFRTFTKRFIALTVAIMIPIIVATIYWTITEINGYRFIFCAIVAYHIMNFFLWIFILFNLTLHYLNKNNSALMAKMKLKAGDPKNRPSIVGDLQHCGKIYKFILDMLKDGIDILERTILIFLLIGIFYTVVVISLSIGRLIFYDVSIFDPKTFFLQCFCIALTFISFYLANIFTNIEQVNSSILSYMYKYKITKLTKEESIAFESLLMLFTKMKPTMNISKIVTIRKSFYATFLGAITTYVLVFLQLQIMWNRSS